MPLLALARDDRSAWSFVVGLMKFGTSIGVLLPMFVPRLRQLHERDSERRFVSSIDTISDKNTYKASGTAPLPPVEE